MAAAVTICLINQKGGCGKSSTCFHLSGALAKLGLRVLLVDCDPQGSLSQGFFGSSLVETLDVSETLACLFDESMLHRSSTLSRVVTPFPAISVVPANQCLAPFNTPRPETTGMTQYTLREFVDRTDGFDCVLFDCPPNLYQCSWNAMIAADFVVVPVPPEDFGTQGLAVVQQAISNAGLLNPKLWLLGHLVIRYDSRLLVHRSYERKLRELHADSVLSTVIPEASAFKVSLSCRMPVTYYAPTSKAARLTSQLACEILDRISVGTVNKHVG